MRGLYGGDEARAGNDGAIGRLRRRRPRRSPKLRRRILASVGVEQRSFGWAPFLAGAACCRLCRGVLLRRPRTRFLATRPRAARAKSRNQIIELTRLNEAFAILNGADTTVTSFGEKQPKPKGKVFCNPSRACC